MRSRRQVIKCFPCRHIQLKDGAGSIPDTGNMISAEMAEIISSGKVIFRGGIQISMSLRHIQVVFERK